MNSLSWLIYAVFVVENIRDVAGIALVIMGVILLFSLLAIPATDGDDAVLYWLKKYIHYAIAPAIVSILILMFVPERQTLLLIAGSEIGERVVHSEQMKAIGEKASSIFDPSVDLLKTWITEETKKLKGEEKKEKK